MHIIVVLLFCKILQSVSSTTPYYPSPSASKDSINIEPPRFTRHRRALIPPRHRNDGKYEGERGKERKGRTPCLKDYSLSRRSQNRHHNRDICLLTHLTHRTPYPNLDTISPPPPCRQRSQTTTPRLQDVASLPSLSIISKSQPRPTLVKQTLNATLSNVAVTHVAALINNPLYAVLSFVKNDLPSDSERREGNSLLYPQPSS